MSKRAQLLENESKIRALWQDSHCYDAHVPNKNKDKYFCTFPFPYMNGRLHIGHAFSVSKSEFQARFQRTQGKHVLWPFGLHCTENVALRHILMSEVYEGKNTAVYLTSTIPPSLYVPSFTFIIYKLPFYNVHDIIGMPIMACADKIRSEMQELGTNGIKYNKVEEQTNAEVKDYTKFTSSKTKLASKSNVKMTQMDIMRHMGIPDEEIHKFANPDYWLTYFSPLAIQDMKTLGLSVDWRRSFITTSRNPYYNKFVEWQFNRLKKLNKLLYGCRPTILSRLVMQPCADHDRSEGEGAIAQEYTVVKLKLESDGNLPFNNLDEPFKEYKGVLASKQVYLLAATLRPETLYGQTNCFVVPDGEYGAYLGFSKPKLTFNSYGVVENKMDTEAAIESCDCIYITSERSAYNMAHQGLVILADVKGSIENLFSVAKYKGMDLIGARVLAPLSDYGTVYVLPMLTASMGKGTGIVICVPSDSPDDYMTLFGIKSNAKFYKEKYNVQPGYCELDPIPIIDIPELGTCGAITLCNEEKIKSSKDTAKLEKCKEILYKRGFYKGTLVVGPYKGSKVSDVKDKIRNDIIRDGVAFIYHEPNKKVVSRSGDECVVGLCNQWYTKFSDEKWKQSVNEHVSNPDKFTCYSESTLNQLKHIIQWLDNWACSRSYGLGTVLPWEDIKKNKNSLIESLSDSTIYMAYYTIVHYLQGDIFGTRPGILNIQPSELNDDAFDYIFHVTSTPPTDNHELNEKLSTMRNEFSYWYPMDLRCSGKDLMFNHLTMSLFVHDAIWKGVKSIEFMPKSYFCNGHVLVDTEKMSKSKGNFLTVEDAIKLYTSDGTRVALADAGDTLDDANFSKETAEAAILKLHLILSCAEKDLLVVTDVTVTDSFSIYAREIFENEIKVLIDKTKLAYENFIYRDALKSCFYDFITIRQNYIQLVKDNVDVEVLKYYYETFCKIANPIIPHICEYIWIYLLKNEGNLSNELWPSASHIDWNLHRKIKLLYKNLEEFRRCKDKSQMLAKKHSGVTEYSKAVIYIAKEYPVLQQHVLMLLNDLKVGETDLTEKEIIKELCASEFVRNASPKDKKVILAFASYQIKEIGTLGPSALLLQLPYSELELYKTFESFILHALNIESVRKEHAGVINNCYIFTPSHPVDYLRNEITEEKKMSHFSSTLKIALREEVDILFLPLTQYENSYIVTLILEW